jgi:hypothetical protein
MAGCSLVAGSQMLATFSLIEHSFALPSAVLLGWSSM